MKRFFSYLGRKDILIPPKTIITLSTKDKPIPHKQPANTFKTTPIKSSIIIKGPLGELCFPLHEGLLLENVDISSPLSSSSPSVRVKIDSELFNSIRKPCQNFIKGMWGTTATNIRNCIKGVNDGFYIPIKLVGVGYKATIEEINRKIILKLGFSNDIVVSIPSNINITSISNTKFLIHGIDLREVSQFAYNIRRYRKPEPYNGKGIFVDDETIILKQKKKKK